MSEALKRIQQKQFTLIAEIGVNYYDIAKKLSISNLDAAKLMIKQAGDSGVHAVKFQSYKAATLAVKNSPAYWDLEKEKTLSQYELFRKFDSFGEAEYRELSAYCKQLNIEFMSTPFDIDSADYLEPLMNVYKISSSDLNNLPFIAHMAKKKKPILLSAGASTLEEIRQSVNVIREYNDCTLTLLHCVLEYPTPYEHANLNKIASLALEFPDVILGYSDHTIPDQCEAVIQTAYSLGATVIEKHFTLDKSLSGNDHYHAMDPDDAKKIIERISFVDMLKGCGNLDVLPSEQTSRRYARRSLVNRYALKSGVPVKEEDLTFKRPGTGISPDEKYNLIGKKPLTDIEADTTLMWPMFE